jgi:hypothetical protein
VKKDAMAVLFQNALRGLRNGVVEAARMLVAQDDGYLHAVFSPAMAFSLFLQCGDRAIPP